MMQVFKDQQLQQTLEKEGFVVVPFLNKKEVDKLAEVYQQGVNKAANTGFHATMFSADSVYKQWVSQRIREVFEQPASRLFEGFEPLYGNFMVKEPGADSTMKMHQDWTYVDESQHTSVAIWCPLIDVDETNGALYMVPRTHHLGIRYRGPYLPEPFQAVLPYIEQKYLRSVPLKAGEAVIWDHGVLHSSPPNLGDTTRVAPTMIFTPKEAAVYHYWIDPADPEQRVEEFLVNEAFYYQYEIGKRPKAGKSQGFVATTFTDLSQQDMDSLFEKRAGNSGFSQLLRKLQQAIGF